MSKIDKSKKDGIGEAEKEKENENGESSSNDLREKFKKTQAEIAELRKIGASVLRVATGLPKTAPDHKVDACVRRDLGLSEDATEAQLDAKVCQELDLPSGSDPLDVLKAVVKKIDQNLMLSKVRDGEKN